MSSPSHRVPSRSPCTIGSAEEVGSSALGVSGGGSVQSSTSDPQASPAPNAVRSNRWPGRTWPCSQASPIAIGIDAAEVLP